MTGVSPRAVWSARAFLGDGTVCDRKFHGILNVDRSYAGGRMLWLGLMLEEARDDFIAEVMCIEPIYYYCNVGVPESWVHITLVTTYPYQHDTGHYTHTLIRWVIHPR